MNTRDMHKLLARQYAKAFINLFGDRLTGDAVARMHKTAQFIRVQRGLLFLLSLPALDPVKKYDGLCTLIARFELVDVVADLIRVLIMDRRAALLPDVLDRIRQFYQDEHDIMPCTITSAHQLTQKDLAVIKGFLAQQTNCSIIYEYTVDQELIAGIRAQSNTVLWEHSIRKQLTAVRATIGK